MVEWGFPGCLDGTCDTSWEGAVEEFPLSILAKRTHMDRWHHVFYLYISTRDCSSNGIDRWLLLKQNLTGRGVPIQLFEMLTSSTSKVTLSEGVFVKLGHSAITVIYNLCCIE